MPVRSDFTPGELASGFLVGTLRGSELTFRFCQQELSGKLDGGASNCTLERLGDGPMQIREEFVWESQTGTGVNLITELPD